MLLRHTPKEIRERSALTINPAKTCQPVGAMYAALGVHRCLPHSHGSQGCCAYHRSMLTRHTKEPVMAATSSFTEGASVFGGMANLTQAIENIFALYDPDVVAVHTTCLSEVIGDDIPQIVKNAQDAGKIPRGRIVIHANTPSFVGSHVTGFAGMTKSLVDYFAEPDTPPTGRVNVIPGFVEPADMAEIKRLAAEMGVEILLFPDTSGVLDAPMTGRHAFYPEGGARVEDLKTMGGSRATLALGAWASAPAAEALEKKAHVPFQVLDTPIGLLATDRFVDALRRAAGVEVPATVTRERGRLVDLLADMAQYFYGKKVALIGDPDPIIALTEFCLTLDMKPVHVVTGTPGKRFEERVGGLLAEAGVEGHVTQAADMFHFHQLIKNEPVDLIIGNTYCKYIARDEGIPLVRHGFPVLDRVGHQFFPSVGYRGAMRLAEKMLDAFLDRIDRETDETAFELVL
ncbi:MAG: nitrogenase molybdenum-iron protein subunit beta [Candidatus Dadabacteria bacterium]|nr:MAG: nitrogenase molybdenum-iron protein subunit beta [Candidatus Dadabacteria bacterium]